MRVVIQRVIESSVTIDGNVKGKIGKGLMILVGFEATDTQEDIDWISYKIVNLRIFPDANGVMNVSILDADGEVLIISQFTLMASTKKLIPLRGSVTRWDTNRMIRRSVGKPVS